MKPLLRRIGLKDFMIQWALRDLTIIPEASGTSPLLS